MESETESNVASKDETEARDQPTPNETLPRRWHSGTIDREHPLGGEMSDIVRGLFKHIRLPYPLWNPIKGQEGNTKQSG